MCEKITVQMESARGNAPSPKHSNAGSDHLDMDDHFSGGNAPSLLTPAIKKPRAAEQDHLKGKVC